MRVYRPTDNPLYRGYLPHHKGYDFRGLNRPDEVRAGKDGRIVQRIDRYENNWINTGSLKTRDYGNYIKIKHDDGTYELHAHLAKGSSLPVKTKVKAGQVVARIGNTGNSTGPHLHSEYRNSENRNIQVEFYTDSHNNPMLPENYEDTVHNSVQWEDFVKKQKLGEPKHISAEAANNLVGGLRSSITAAQRERDEARKNEKTGQLEISNLRSQLLKGGKVRDAALRESKELRKELDKKTLALGKLAGSIQRLETENRELRKSVTTGLSSMALIKLGLLKLLKTA